MNHMQKGNLGKSEKSCSFSTILVFGRFALLHFPRLFYADFEFLSLYVKDFIIAV